MTIQKLEYKKSKFTTDIDKLYENQTELTEKLNQVIDLLNKQRVDNPDYNNEDLPELPDDWNELEAEKPEGLYWNGHYHFPERPKCYPKKTYTDQELAQAMKKCLIYCKHRWKSDKASGIHKAVGKDIFEALLREVLE